MKSNIIITEIVDPTWGQYYLHTAKLIDKYETSCYVQDMIAMCHEQRIKGQVAHVHVYHANLPAIIDPAWDYQLDEQLGVFLSLPEPTQPEIYIDGEPPVCYSDFQSISLAELDLWT